MRPSYTARERRLRLRKQTEPYRPVAAPGERLPADRGCLSQELSSLPGRRSFGLLELHIGAERQPPVQIAGPLAKDPRCYRSFRTGHPEVLLMKSYSDSR